MWIKMRNNIEFYNNDVLEKKETLIDNIKVAFVNPPYVDWVLANNSAYLMFQSYYKRHGKYVDRVNWLKAPYKFNRYSEVKDIYEDGIQDADIYLFSSYSWNYEIVDKLSAFIKDILPNSICVLGGPHIGTYDLEFLDSRKQYDFILRPTKPGEIFVQELIDDYFYTNRNPNFNNLSWELRSNKTCAQFLPDYSVYREHIDFLKETREYATTENIEPFAILETTRGCPYQCVFCEWGGGIGSKIYKKPDEVVREDIIALKESGYQNIYSTDANFGVFFERDVDIFKFAWENNVKLTDISTLKSKDLDRRIKLIDAWFNIIGAAEKTTLGYDRQRESLFNFMGASNIPTVSFQSISDAAMKIAKRSDLNFSDKVKLSEYIHAKCQVQGYPFPPLELILAMPGSTLDDFYNEMDLIWNFKSWGTIRHDYMFLPDSELSKKEYLEKYNIKIVEVYNDLAEEDRQAGYTAGLYRGIKHYFKTISSCFSFTFEESCEMWIMNLFSNWLLKNIYPKFETMLTPPEFGKLCWEIIKEMEDFQPLWGEVKDILNPETPPKNIKMLNGVSRGIFTKEFLEKHSLILSSEITIRTLS